MSNSAKQYSWAGTMLVAVAGVVAMLFATSVSANTIYDPLHGTCNGTAGACTDNGTNTPLGNSTKFGFTISPGPQTGDLTVVALIPNTETFTPSTITETVPNSTSYNFTQVSGVWNANTLASFLGIDASPSNGIGAFLPSTQIFDSTASGYNVFTADVGSLTISATGSGGSDPTFNMINNLPLGSYLVSFCAGSTPGGDCTVGSKTSTTEVATVNSGALFANGNTPVPEPGTLVLFGSMMLMLLGAKRRLRGASAEQ